MGRGPRRRAANEPLKPAWGPPMTPTATCVREDCLACPIQGAVHCHFRLSDLARFLAIALPSLLLAAAAVRMYDARLLGLWAVGSGAFFGLVEIRVLCSHCPHYAEPGRVLRCWANRYSPKLWRYRPGPLSRTERLVFFSGIAVIWGFPLALGVLGGESVLVAGIVVSSVGFYAALRRRFCSQCMNFACPLNIVPQAVQIQFRLLNPSTGPPLES